MRLAFSCAYRHGEISSPEPESSELTSPTYHAPAQLIHSPQPTTSAPADSHARRDLRATRYAAQLNEQCRYKADMASSDDPHAADSPIEERP